MVGRDFVPTEDMGEWTVHLDAPEGTSLEGLEEIAMPRGQGAEGIEGVAEIQPIVNPGGSGAAGAAAAATHDAFHFNFRTLPLDERKVTQERDGHRDAAAAGGASGLPAEHHQPQPARRRRRPGGFPISANLLGPDLDSWRTIRCARSNRRRSCRASPTRRSP